MTRSDFKKLSEARITDAKVLLGARRFDAAYYLAGYSVECAIKAYITKQIRKYQFPEGPEKVRKIYTHNLEDLIKVVELSDQFQKEIKSDAALETNWGIAKDWSEQTRYHRNGKIAEKKAKAMIDAVSDPTHGVLQCLQRYW